MKQVLIEAKSLSLDIPFFQPGSQRLLSKPKEILSNLYVGRTKRQTNTILNDVSFTLKAGERLGVIGQNGAGKSTLLRIIAGVYSQTHGTLKINGSVKGLFHISIGMSMEGTGLENIYLRGLQMGLNMKEIRTYVPHVIEFSELEDHIHRPINTYSTGMMLRLAFAISTMIEPDILVLDEWIGAGDAHFRIKAKERMDSLVDHSRGLVLATHSPALMKRICTKGIVLERGEVVYSGAIDNALEYYNENIVVSANKKAAKKPGEVG